MPAAVCGVKTVFGTLKIDNLLTHWSLFVSPLCLEYAMVFTHPKPFAGYLSFKHIHSYSVVSWTYSLPLHKFQEYDVHKMYHRYQVHNNISLTLVYIMYQTQT